MTPAKTPGPMMATNSRPQISELIDREATISNSASGRTTRALGVVLRAAKKATGTAMTIAINVPSVAMFRVSQSGPRLPQNIRRREGSCGRRCQRLAAVRPK